jgi:nucleoside-diphosphate-sugar epimerase
MAQALNGAEAILLGNLEPRRDLTFVEDTARAFLLAAETPDIEGQVIHFGQGQAVSIGEVAQRCLDVVGSKARLVSVSERQRPEKSEVGLLLCDAAKARQILKWTPQVSLDEGLRRTADYVRANLRQYRQEGYAV